MSEYHLLRMTLRTEFFSLTLTFYLWHALITQKLDIEKKCFVYISGMIWVYTTIYNGILLRNIGKDDILVSHSTLMLWRYWINFSNYSNRRNAIKLGEAARLCVWCYISVILLLLLLIPRAIYHDPTNVLIVEICNFGSALVGTLLFLVFGTQKKAAVFLPCCYYVPPGTPQFLPDETTDGNNNNSNELTHMPIAHIRQK
ncbi:hypothetical protein RhiirA1_393510 [Rhizophagus irregularis]|uniref:Uncharacterized protein n=1 Tax=Rhizophagus irregularis TaxID=588596 RepID=A0A2N0RWL3_9GLOM|nr:hypothetical protein RhiirA1_393510 [Rhizophagus irregularis]